MTAPRDRAKTGASSYRRPRRLTAAVTTSAKHTIAAAQTSMSTA
ncbi:hypothetical protein QTP70_023249 [Hemibagrus guttatus]|uniref:Uncharacterized protein n=1 Tax=Hemibagrus guttatus TaxID=175788 RepID=A0AAE0RF73_9TELE|nr:hypothetical protein QTP70_023249 [Hemibagrus guttatus]